MIMNDKNIVRKEGREGMKIVGDEIAYDGRFIQTLKRSFIDRDGKPALWEMVKRKTHGRIFAVAAVTPEKELVLEKIFRIPCDSYVLELPAGLRDKDGETEEEAARRELLEETGYAADHLELLIAGPFNAGMLEDELAIYLGVNARKVQESRLESAEDIEVVLAPLEKLVERLESEREAKVDVKIPAVLPFLKKRGIF